MDRYETAAKAWYDDEVGDSWPELAKQLREHFPEPGRCGECRWWLGNTGSGVHGESRGCKQKDNSPGVVCHVYTMADFSCPRFERRADKYEELAREYLSTRRLTLQCGTKTNEDDAHDLADFLRERVTVREGE